MTMNDPGHKGVLDKALDTEKRIAFLNYNTRKAHESDLDELAQMSAYIMSDDLIHDIERLKRGDYFFPPPFHYRISKDHTGRKRDLYVFKGRDLYILKLITWILRDYDDMFPEGLYSFRCDLHVRDFIIKLRDHEGLSDHYVVKADVSNYVGSVVPELLITMLEKLWSDDQELLGLFKFLLLSRKCIELDGRVCECEPGGLGGLPIANYFMNVYLMEMDRYFYPIAPLYCRYSDDVIILAKDESQATEFYGKVLEFFDRNRLSTNDEKTRIIPPKGAVDILGYSLHDGKIDLSAHAIEKYKRKFRIKVKKILLLKKREHLSDQEAGRLLVDYYNLVFFAANTPRELDWLRWYFPVITTTDGLRELDHYVQDSIRYVMFGKKKKKRFNIRYDDFAPLGYRTLVNSYYHYRSAKMQFNELYTTERNTTIRTLMIPDVTEHKQKKSKREG